jgi:hypothetical protein
VSERRGYQVVPCKAGCVLARFWQMTRAPSSPPRFPEWLEDETKIVKGSVALHGGVKLVVA